MRIKVPLPDSQPIHHSHYTLTVADMNYGNHLGNDRVLTLAHEARLRFLREEGHDELNFFGSALIMTDALIQYKGQGYMGDKLLFNLWLTDITERTFKFVVQILKEQDGPQQEIARIQTGMLFFDYNNNRPAKASPTFLKRFSQRES